MRLPWKHICPFGFILLGFLSGCGERQPSIEELTSQAEILLEAGRINDAVRILERCEAREPQRVDVLESLAFAYSANGDPALASLTFLRIAEIVPQQPEYLLYAAESLIESGDSKGAAVQYKAYLAVRPRDRAVWVTLADLMVSSGRLNEALEALLAADQLNAKAVQRIAIGRLYLQKQNLAQAQAWFGRALQGDHEVRDQALLGLLETAIRAKRFADAESLLTQLDAEYPGRLEQSDIDHVRDQLLEWRDRQNAAREALAALEEQRPSITINEAPSEPVPVPQVTPETENAVSGEQVDIEPDPEPELESPTVVVSSNPEPGLLETIAPGIQSRPIPEAVQTEDNLSLARAKRSVGDLDGAINRYKQALVLDDNQPEVWAELSETYLESGNARWAQATASEAMRRDPDDPKLMLQFLRAAQQTMSPERLIREMESAYRKFPGQPEIILVLARAFADQNNDRNARLLYRKFLELVAPDHPARADVEADLRQLGG